MYNYTSAHFVLLSSFHSFPSTLHFLFSLGVSFPLPVSLFLFHTLSVFLQTVPGVELRSSRVNLSWRWRNSGTSAASDVGPATWSSPESTSASECVKSNTTFQCICFYLTLLPFTLLSPLLFELASFVPIIV